jgi:5'-methylthioadenosine nucleosidase
MSRLCLALGDQQPLLHLCCICRVSQPAPCVTFSGKTDGLTVHVAWNGRCGVHGVDNVGTVPAAIAAYLAIQAFKPDLVISAGTAGGMKSKVCCLRLLT